MSELPELYLCGWEPPVPAVTLASPAQPLQSGPSHRPVDTAVEADDDRQREKTKENQSEFKIPRRSLCTLTMIKKDKKKKKESHILCTVYAPYAPSLMLLLLSAH